MLDSFEYQALINNVSAYALTDLGKIAIQESKPLFNRLIIKRDSARLKDAFALVNKGYDIELPQTMDINYELNAVSKGIVLTSNQCLKVMKVARAVIALRKQYRSFNEVKTIHLDELFATLEIDASFLTFLNKVIDDAGEIKEDASETLLNLNRELAITKGRFDKVIAHFIQNNKASLQESFTMTRDGRVCVLVMVKDKNKFHGYQHGESASGLASYVEPDTFIHYNNEIASINANIEQEIHALLVQCSQIIASHKDALLANMETCVLIDSIMAKAKWGVSNQGCVAQLQDDNYGYELVRVRHPLIDAKKVVANNIVCTNGKKIILITGANTAGKTVLLKTIGLAFYMMASGLPILADEAKLSLIDRILDDIGDQQSIVESLSTFSSHVHAWKVALDKASQHSLVLLDELGTGTDPKEGQALGQALLERLVDKGCYVVATTHFQSIKEYGLTQESVICGAMNFDVDQLKPTYQFIQGSLGVSYAFEIASEYGLDQQLIERAKYLKVQQEHQSERLMKMLATKEKELLEQAELLEVQKQLFENEQESFKQAYNDKLKKLENTYQDKLEQLTSSMETKMETLESLLASIKPHMPQNEIAIIKAKAKQLNPNIIETNDEPLKIGDMAKINGSNSIVEIISIQGNKVDALLNGKTIHTKLNKLSKTIAQMPVKKVAKKVAKDFTPTPVQTRLNILGHTVEEGISAVDSFIDQALVANQKRIVVITGDGSGRLRSGIHDHLRKNRYVDHFELAPRSEGATGATVVYLK